MCMWYSILAVQLLCPVECALNTRLKVEEGRLWVRNRERTYRRVQNMYIRLIARVRIATDLAHWPCRLIHYARYSDKKDIYQSCIIVYANSYCTYFACSLAYSGYSRTREIHWHWMFISKMNWFIETYFAFSLAYSGYSRTSNEIHWHWYTRAACPRSRSTE